MGLIDVFHQIMDRKLFRSFSLTGLCLHTNMLTLESNIDMISHLLLVAACWPSPGKINHRSSLPWFPFLSVCIKVADFSAKTHHLLSKR